MRRASSAASGSSSSSNRGRTEQGACDGHALAFPTGQSVDVALEQGADAKHADDVAECFTPAGRPAR